MTRLSVTQVWQAYWNQPPRPSWIADAAILVAIATLCSIRAYIGLSTVNYFTDVFIYLDGGWRVLHGQLPQNDFYGSVGPITYWLAAFGLRITGTAQGWVYAQTIFGFLVGLWTYFLTRQFARLPAALLIVAVTLFAVTPFNFGETPGRLSGGMVYNRFSYSLAALVLVECVHVIRPSRSWAAFFAGFSTGLAMAILLFLKISFFLGASLAVAALVAVKPQSLRRWTGMFAGFLLFVSIVFIVYRGNFLPAMEELLTVAHAKQLVFRGAYIETAVNSGFPFLALVLLGGAILWNHDFRREGRAIIWTGCVVFTVGFALLLGNWQLYDLPLNVVGAILILQKISARRSLRKSSTFLPAILLGMVLVVGHMCIDIYGLAIGLPKRAALARDPSTRFDAAVLDGFRCDDREYVRRVNDGLALARQYRGEAKTLMTLDLVNPFSYSLGMTPPKGGATWLGYGNNFDEEHGPSPEQVFGNAELVMEPKTFSDPNIPFVYGEYLSSHFMLLGESTDWRILRRRH